MVFPALEEDGVVEADLPESGEDRYEGTVESMVERHKSGV